MNQLYHPRNTASFFQTLDTLKVEVYVISNNAVGSQETCDASGKKTDDGWTAFLDINLKPGYFFSSMNGGSSVLKDFARTYYTSKYNPPRRAFDFYTACALVNHMYKINFGSKSNLFFDASFGVTIVSQKSNWVDAVNEYASHIDVSIVEGDIPFIKTKKTNFKSELDILKASTACEMVSVYNVEFSETPGGVLRVIK